MKLFKVAIVMVFAACLTRGAIAGDANPIEMAHNVGFIGCDSVIADAFENAMKASDRRFSINYFDETARISVDLIVTYGSPGDTVLQTVHFDKIGGYCYSTVRTVISEPGNCAGILNKSENFKYKDDSAGALWAENKGGVIKILIQSGNACNQIYVRSNKMKATK